MANAAEFRPEQNKEYHSLFDPDRTHAMVDVSDTSMRTFVKEVTGRDHFNSQFEKYSVFVLPKWATFLKTNMRNKYDRISFVLEHVRETAIKLLETHSER